MDSLFLTQVPNIPDLGSLVSETSDTPTAHAYNKLEFTLTKRDAQYSQFVHEVAFAIACARLDSNNLELWQNAVEKKQTLMWDDKQAIAYALARGICHSGYCGPSVSPVCNENNFKGHIVEVLLFCLRIYLLRKGSAHPLALIPGKPKPNPATPGIDLLEIGETSQGYYFQIWECKGTDGSFTASFTEAADQLCSPSGTAYQSFMESHRCLLEDDTLKHNGGLNTFTKEMPRRFYGSTPDRSKRLGGVVGSGASYSNSCWESFLIKLNGSVYGGHHNCQTVAIKINNFPQFREDVFKYLWNI